MRVRTVPWNPAILDRGASLRPDNAELLLPITDSTGGMHVGRVAYWLQFAVESRAAAVARMPEAMRAEARAAQATQWRHRPWLLSGGLVGLGQPPVPTAATLETRLGVSGRPPKTAIG